MDPTLAQLLTGGFDQRFNDAYTDPAIALQLQQQAVAPPAAPIAPAAAYAPVAPAAPPDPGYPWSQGSVAPTASMATDMAPPSPAPPPTPAASVGGNSILNSLRGVTAPAAPQAQKVGTPHTPQLRPIQGGELVNMLAAMGLGPRDIWTPPRIRTGGG